MNIPWLKDIASLMPSSRSFDGHPLSHMLASILWEPNSQYYVRMWHLPVHALGSDRRLHKNKNSKYKQCKND